MGALAAVAQQAAVMQEPSAIEGNDDISSDWERLSEYIADNDWEQSSYVSLSSAAQQQLGCAPGIGASASQASRSTQTQRALVSQCSV